MSRLCRAPGCSSQTTSRYSPYCTTHRARLRRHGAVDQEAVTKAQLAPYLRQVVRRVEKNKSSPLWAQLEERWEALQSHARGVLAAYQRGQPMVRYERIAAHAIVTLGEPLEPREVIHTVLAMFMMQQDQPHRFPSDAGFRMQLVRRVRGLAEVNAGEWYDHKTGKTKRVYKDLAPKAAVIIGQWLAEAFGGAGIHLAKLEERDRQKQQDEVNALHEALKGLE
ncbi:MULTISPECIES: hypothetical protein [unclassified Chelatococcus]|uniref:hypothetical protein n=2 Tax=Hyphomicrobiales TaxID=356 RepID=UPI001BD091E5|nr:MULTISPECIES: hypothetical protein [unclassified Chelatococcus]MBX3491299.1 hypothetical protein [Parvibaculum sp.]CAH1656700.1 conserved hypothetical protein [Hyphomicrobiales bacterium]MBS7740574.1 hypothetical protein [Chelatococcus sp. HY11]MBX3544642.1 hypothetical protein [Chelatococcus sp.]MCO5078183.1 hypothetical protein [Chelatococcus sp.]